MKVYHYSQCSTCKKALKFLDAKKVSYQQISIVEQPPSMTELKKMLKFIENRGGSIKSLFNTSGVLYREMGVASLLKEGMPDSKALTLLSQHGKLVKRPFILGKADGVVGFKEAELKQVLSNEKK